MKIKVRSMKHQVNILALALSVFFFIGNSYAVDFCQTDADCPQLNCLDCGTLCIENKCKTFNCKEHGRYDLKERKCVCNDGYTGKFCEKREAIQPNFPPSEGGTP